MFAHIERLTCLWRISDNTYLTAKEISNEAIMSSEGDKKAHKKEKSS